MDPRSILWPLSIGTHALADKAGTYTQGTPPSPLVCGKKPFCMAGAEVKTLDIKPLGLNDVHLMSALSQASRMCFSAKKCAFAHGTSVSARWSEAAILTINSTVPLEMAALIELISISSWLDAGGVNRKSVLQPDMWDANASTDWLRFPSAASTNGC